MRWQVNVGVNYPTAGGERRADPGDIVDDLPADVVDAWEAEGVVTRQPTRRPKAYEEEEA